jgi:hypothetical protein
MNPNLVDIILVIVLVALVGLACLYIYKSKKAGAVCIGCPYAKECAKKGNCPSKNENSNKTTGGSCCH